MPSSRLGIRSLGASGSAGVACLLLAQGLGACARVCAGGELEASPRVTVFRRDRVCERGAHSQSGGQPGLSEPLGLGWLRADLRAAATAKARRAVGQRWNREVRPWPKRQRRAEEHGTARGPGR